jgi:hypothetical protein
MALNCTGAFVSCFGRQDFTKREVLGLELLYLQSMGYLCFSASLNGYILITRAHSQSHIILRLVLDPSNGCQRLVAGMSHGITVQEKARKTYLVSQFCKNKKIICKDLCKYNIKIIPR